MGVLLALGMLGMILDGKTAMQGASQGVELCLTAVIPSLLPFLCLSMLLTMRLMGQKLRILSPIGKLFGLPMGAEALLIPALLGGYPAGAACVAQAVWREQLNRRDGKSCWASAICRDRLFCSALWPGNLQILLPEPCCGSVPCSAPGLPPGFCPKEPIPRQRRAHPARTPLVRLGQP